MKTRKPILILALALIAVSSTQIRPLYAGTLILEDRILRSNTCIFKTLPLPFTKAQYEAKNIEVVAAMTQLSIDQNFTYQFRYQILCSETCYIDFVLSRYSLYVSQDFEYKMVIDFLVAENMLTQTVNMTFHKTDVNLRSLTSLIQTSSLANEAQFDWEVILIPNGFNNVTKTGYLSHIIDKRLNKLIITYNDQTNGHGLADFMGWKLNQNFIYFKIVLIPKRLISSQRKCQPSKIFVGFLSTQKSSIKFQVQKNEEKSNSQNQFELPMNCQTEFKDERIAIDLQYETKAQKSSQGIQATYIYAIIPLLIAEVLYILYKKRMANKQNKGEKEIKLPDMLISFQTTQIVFPTEPKDLQKCETKDSIVGQLIEADQQ